MNSSTLLKNNKQVANWLMIGAVMIVIQFVLGAVTRLTESGLSITEWKPVSGALPPLHPAAWQLEFDKYKLTDQFKYVHPGFTLSDFKFIFFWEWFHRLWARTMGLVFLAGFIYFLVKRKFNRGMIIPMVILFLLGALQGAIGWLMVKSGLVPEKYFVGHVELTTHFIAAMVLLAYVLWFAMGLQPAMQQKLVNRHIKNWVTGLLVLVFIQLIYGGFMAGLRAGHSAPTWPSINGSFFPADATEMAPPGINFTSNPLMVHFIHRGMAYLLFTVTLLFFIKTRQVQHKLFMKYRNLFCVLILIQVVLGVLTVLNSPNPQALVWLGTLHQFTAIMIVICLVTLLKVTSSKTEPDRILK